MSIVTQSLNFQKVKQAAQITNSLDHPIRSKILNHVSNNPGINVTDLYIKFRCEQSEMSQDLAILRKAGLLISKRDPDNKKNIRYSVSDNSFKILNAINKFASSYDCNPDEK